MISWGSYPAPAQGDSILGDAVDLNELAESPEGFFDQSFGDLQEELEIIQDEGKKGLLVMFETEDCPWCLRMKQTVLNRRAVQDFYGENFRVLNMDAEGDVLITDFDGNDITTKEFSLKAMRVRATPVFAFFDASGELVTRYTGALKNAHDFMLLGRYVTDGHHAEIRFSKFRRENQPG
jgi:thioredoxin-related protein